MYTSVLIFRRYMFVDTGNNILVTYTSQHFYITCKPERDLIASREPVF